MTDNDDFHPWWKVKLAQPTWIEEVEITMDTGEHLLYIWVKQVEIASKKKMS